MGDTVKDMTAKFGKLDKFEGNDFKRWQKKMHFLLTTLKVVYVLSTPMPEFVEDEPVETRRGGTRRATHGSTISWIRAVHLVDPWEELGQKLSFCD
ncbi:hypothetical protein Tco_0656431 [Tanacetum coccineum]|uniref:Zinc finger, CCHC-type n=1 Tax=Tanacetum coccineum TaxID=301880 RepID=A0ABQ4XA10_9ASTR